MPLPYAKNKQHIYKWRENHLERAREINCKYQRKYDAWKRISKIYLQILRD